VVEFVEPGNVTRLVAQLADNLSNRNLSAIHQDCPNRRPQRADGFEQSETRFTIDARVDHHQVEILETALTDRPHLVDGRTHIDAFLFREVSRHSDVTGIEIDDEQPDWRIHRGSFVAIASPRPRNTSRANQMRTPALDAFLLTGRPRDAVPGSSSTGRAGTGVSMSTARLLARIRREFKNHPGIVVTLPQAQSLWSLDKSHCTQVFETLMAEGFLNRVGDVYLWPEAPTPRFKIGERTRAYH